MDQVVCIKDSWYVPNHPSGTPLPSFIPVKGGVYTPVGSFESPYGTFLQLAENAGIEGYRKDWFRPVRKTSIESLRAILVNPNQKIKETAL